MLDSHSFFSDIDTNPFSVGPTLDDYLSFSTLFQMSSVPELSASGSDGSPSWSPHKRLVTPPGSTTISSSALGPPLELFTPPGAGAGPSTAVVTNNDPTLAPSPQLSESEVAEILALSGFSSPTGDNNSPTGHLGTAVPPQVNQHAQAAPAAFGNAEIDPTLLAGSALRFAPSTPVAAYRTARPTSPLTISPAVLVGNDAIQSPSPSTPSPSPMSQPYFTRNASAGPSHDVLSSPMSAIPARMASFSHTPSRAPPMTPLRRTQSDDSPLRRTEESPLSLSALSLRTPTIKYPSPEPRPEGRRASTCRNCRCDVFVDEGSVLGPPPPEAFRTPRTPKNRNATPRSPRTPMTPINDYRDIATPPHRRASHREPTPPPPGQFLFINYTVDDADLLCAGVAPSGGRGNNTTASPKKKRRDDNDSESEYEAKAKPKTPRTPRTLRKVSKAATLAPTTPTPRKVSKAAAPTTPTPRKKKSRTFA